MWQKQISQPNSSPFLDGELSASGRVVECTVRLASRTLGCRGRATFRTYGSCTIRAAACMTTERCNRTWMGARKCSCSAPWILMPWCFNTMASVATVLSLSLKTKLKWSSWVDYSVKSMLFNKAFLTWLLIGWRSCNQPVICQVWKSLLTNMHSQVPDNTRHIMFVRWTPTLKYVLARFYLIWSISWMWTIWTPWLLASPCHQQPWYWLDNIARHLKDFTCITSVWGNGI